MGIKADSGAKFDQGGINQVLALIVDLDDNDLGILIDRLLQEQHRRDTARGKNLGTIQT